MIMTGNLMSLDSEFSDTPKENVLSPRNFEYRQVERLTIFFLEIDCVCVLYNTEAIQMPLLYPKIGNVVCQVIYDIRSYFEYKYQVRDRHHRSVHLCRLYEVLGDRKK